MNYSFYGCDVTELASVYGTPLYVVSENEIRAHIGELKDNFDDKYGNCKTYFASKAFLTKDMLRIIMDEELGLDVVSGGELFLAKQMRFPAQRIAFHGNSKTTEEIDSAIDYGVGLFVCDSEEEILLIDKMSAKKGCVANILIRITPGVDCKTHSYIATASIDSKFGVPLANAKKTVAMCMELKNISLEGFHFHVGSQLLENTSHLLAVDILLNLIKEIKDELSYEPKAFNLGGGFGIAYTTKDVPPPVSEFISPMVERIQDFCARNNIKMPQLMIEPGRFIVGKAGITLYTVGSIKEIPGIKTYVGVDGGFPDNPRPSIYQAEYDALIANKYEEEPGGVVTVAGKCCESGDILIKDIRLPKAERGDILLVFATGAYGHSMANNYNKNPIPAIVMIKDGKPRLSVKRQTYEEMFASNI